MTPPPLVSVVIDSRNRGNLFAEAMGGDLSQDFPVDQFELLVVDDDGATDDTAERIRKYGTRAIFSYQD